MDGMTEGARSKEAGETSSKGRVMEGTRVGEDMVVEGVGGGITISRMEAIKEGDTKGDITMVVIEVSSHCCKKEK